MRLLAGQRREGQLQCYRTAPSAARLTWEGPAHEGLHQSRLGQAGAPAGPLLPRTSGPPSECHMGQRATVKHAGLEALLLLKDEGEKKGVSL